MNTERKAVDPDIVYINLIKSDLKLKAKCNNLITTHDFACNLHKEFPKIDFYVIG